jgi:hypothetical protein
MHRQRARCQQGGTMFPRRTAIYSITKPVVVQSRNAITEDSRPKLPPVRTSGPLMLDRIKPAAGAVPETIPEKIADCV